VDAVAAARCPFEHRPAALNAAVAINVDGAFGLQLVVEQIMPSRRVERMRAVNIPEAGLRQRRENLKRAPECGSVLCRVIALRHAPPGRDVRTRELADPRA